MHVWKGWAGASNTVTKTALTWDEWRIYHQQVLGVEQDERAREHAPQQECVTLTERELARLAFGRWLYQTGRLDPTQDDNL